MIRRLSGLLSLLVFPAALAAQTTVHGTVVDQQTGAPIVGATVVVTGTTTSATTNEAGAFSLSSSGGISSVTASRSGYSSAAAVVTDPNEPLRIRLSPVPVKLTGIEVAAERPTSAVSTLTKSDLDRATGLSLENSINTVPGVLMQSRTPWGGARITIRGYYPSTSGNSPNSNGLGYQVFLNDIPVTDATGTTVLDDVDYSTLGRVEVIKGPSSSRYGSAIGGAVIMTTERPAPNQTRFGQQLLAGTDGLLRSNTSLQSANITSAISLDYGYQKYNSFRPHSASHKKYVRASGDFDVGDRQILSTYFAYTNSREQLAGEIDSTAFYARDPQSNPLYLANDSHIDLISTLGGVTDHYQLSDKFSNQTTLFGSSRASNQPFAHGFTDVNQFNVGARSEFGYDAQAGSVGVTGSLGALVQRSNLTQNGVFIIPAPPFVERPTDQENWATALSVYTEWHFALANQVTVTAGASLNKNVFAIRNMLDNNQLYDTTQVMKRSFRAVVTPRIAITKGLGNHGSLYAGVSTGYTPPLLSNTVASDGSVDLTLKPERAVQYEVGAQGSSADNRLSAQVSLYDVENTDKLVSETANAVTFTTNAGKQRNKGVEASLSYKLVDNGNRSLSLVQPWITYSYTRATFVDFRSDNNGNSSTVDFSGNAVPRVPPNVVAIGLDAATNTGVYLNGTFQYVDKVPVTFDNSTYVRSYHLLGAKIGYQARVASHWMLNVFGGGDNLLGSTYYSFLFVGPNYSGLAQDADGGRGDGYIIPGPYKAQLYANGTLRYVF
jgi:iron complex outermembrane recepter protein